MRSFAKTTQDDEEKRTLARGRRRESARSRRMKKRVEKPSGLWEEKSSFAKMAQNDRREKNSEHSKNILS